MPPEVVQFLQDLLNAFQSFAQNAVDEESIQIFEDVVQWSAILLSALSGTYAARKFGMDFFGALVIAFVVSVGSVPPILAVLEELPLPDKY
jgi:hypothetical protein